MQNPVRLSDLSEPQPDLALVRARPDDYTESHPTPPDVLLLIEVADSSAAFDRGAKAPLYAASGIPEYWLIDIAASRIEGYRHPERGRYREITPHRSGDVLRVMALPDLVVPVDDVLG